MQFQNNPFASLQQPQFGQMAGPGGFAGGGFGGMFPQVGGGMFGKPKKGFDPRMFAAGGLLGGMLGGNHQAGMMLSPLGYGLYQLLK